MSGQSALVNQPAAAVTAASTTPPTPVTPTVGGRTLLRSFASRLSATPRAKPPGIVPVASAPAGASQPAANPPVPAVIAPAEATHRLGQQETPPVEAGTPPAGSATPTPQLPAATTAPRVLGRGGVAMADESIADRVQRERNRLLRAEYGTTDLAEIEKIKQLREVQLKEYATLKAAQEAAAREAMSEQQRLTTDLEAAHATIKQLQDQLADVQQGQIVNEQTQQIQGIAGKYVDQDLLWASMIKFQAYLNGLDPREHKRITPRSIDRWFAKFIEDNPKFKIQPTVMTQPDGTVVTNGTAAVGNRGADSPGPSPATVVKPRVVPRKVGITTNAQPKGGPPAPKATTPAAGTVQGKTPKPGQANSMNNQELKSYLRGRGIRPW